MTKIPGKDQIVLKKQSAAVRISEMMQLLQKLPREKADEDLFRTVCGWVMELPPGKRPEILSSTIAQAFAKSVEEVDLVLRQIDRRTEFDALVPATGWLREYIEWTRKTEPPTVFHFFIGAASIGAALGRNVFFDKGAYQVFPNMCVMIIAPTGTCRKTSACNLGTGLYVKSGGTLIGGDKPTPEALVDGLKENANAVGLIYAPELAVFLGKQKYQEGMVPLLTALFDSPSEWTSKTIGRGEISLTNVALSALFCSTIDWIQTGIAKDAFGGGFMSRFLFVVQDSTSRSFPLPPKMNQDMRKDLIKQLTSFKSRKGIFTFDSAGEDWYRQWYKTRPAAHADRQYAGYFERKPDHIIRLAMIMKVAGTTKDAELVLSDADLIHSERILTWLEQYLPNTFDEMTVSGIGEDQARIVRHLKTSGGSMEHSLLLRKNSTKMNAETFKRAMTTLREAKLVEWDASSRTYYLTADGWGV